MREVDRRTESVLMSVVRGWTESGRYGESGVSVLVTMEQVKGHSRGSGSVMTHLLSVVEVSVKEMGLRNPPVLMSAVCRLTGSGQTGLLEVVVHVIPLLVQGPGTGYARAHNRSQVVMETVVKVTPPSVHHVRSSAVRRSMVDGVIGVSGGSVSVNTKWARFRGSDRVLSLLLPVEEIPARGRGLRRGTVMTSVRRTVTSGTHVRHIAKLTVTM